MGAAMSKLTVAVAPNAPRDVDPIVDARVNRTATADTLKEAADAASRAAPRTRRKLAERRTSLLGLAATAATKASPGPAADVKRDLDAQQAVVQQAESSFASPPPGLGPSNPFAGRKGREGVKQGATDELNLRR